MRKSSGVDFSESTPLLASNLLLIFRMKLQIFFRSHIVVFFKGIYKRINRCITRIFCDYTEIRTCFFQHDTCCGHSCIGPFLRERFAVIVLQEPFGLSVAKTKVHRQTCQCNIPVFVQKSLVCKKASAFVQVFGMCAG